ncbi:MULTISPECIES: dihydrolipoyl dehydrogenase family protein [Azospirillum]|uniref:NAD(P)/FAD-dependent oxidoreductase n=1 Tax=Azospirillum brasilense TaxID=192 RepID=A0A6L3B1J5_AZOBR|nr:NAD(P)/FAD-dependent oxidoreductase [Azospirillum brasilense]KAA0686143.1 NAD(P)/FAD-dependent oxidoreductase [Azospirillum brasilense]
MGKSYDLVVIGTGTAAMVASSRVRAAGWSVAVIDHRPFGGTCALRGCDPKKMLVTGAEAVDLARRMHGRGVAGGARIDWRDLIAFKRTFTDPVPEKHEHRYADKGIDAYHGRARFVGPDAVAVNGTTLTVRHVLIAAGARPAPLGFPGEEHLVTNEEFLEMEALPKRIAMVGGGYIAAEFSHIAARAGAAVTIVQRGSRMLTGFDPDLVGWLMERFKEIGVDVRTGTAVAAVEKTATGFAIRTRSAEGERAFEADLVVHAAGRVPALDDLGLDTAGVARDGGRLKLNEHLQSVSNPKVYAAGDAAAVGPPLTPVSSHDAKVVAANLLDGNMHRPDYRGVPSVAFTLPPIARVGLSEEEARGQGLRFRMKAERVPDWYTARRVAETVYGFKVLVEEGTECILGAHLVGPHADEVINIFGLAIRHGLTADDLKTTMFAYPTGASDIGYML